MIFLLFLVTGFTGVYMIIIVIWSALAMSAQIIFQVILLSKRTTNEPYGSMLPNCKFITVIEPDVKLNVANSILIGVVRELCDMRDGVKQCDYLDNDEMCILLTALCTD